MATRPRARGRAAPRGSTRPTMEDHRPPADASGGNILMSNRGRGDPRPLSAELGFDNGQPPEQRSALLSHRADILTTDSALVQGAVVPDRSLLASSESSTGEEMPEAQGGSVWVQFNCSPLLKVLSDPNSLESIELEWLAHCIVHVASQTAEYARPTAQLCANIVARMADEAFLQKLLALGQDGLDERLEAPPRASAESPPLSWLPFVVFLAELLVRLRSNGSGDAAASRPVAAEEPATNPAQQLAALLCDCCLGLLYFRWRGSDEQVECLWAALIVAGADMECEAQGQVQELFSVMRKAFVQPGLSAYARLALLELLELRASGWHMNEEQMEYYTSRSSDLVDMED